MYFRMWSKIFSRYHLIKFIPFVHYSLIYVDHTSPYPIVKYINVIQSKYMYYTKSQKHKQNIK